MVPSPDAYRALQRFRESLRAGAAFSADLTNADGVYFVFALFIANFARLLSGATIIQTERDLRSFLNSRGSGEPRVTAFDRVFKHFPNFYTPYFRIKDPRITYFAAI